MVKNFFEKALIFLLSLFASWALFYFVISEVLTRLMQPSIILCILIMLFVAFVFYISVVSIISKKFNKFYIDIIAILYFLMVIGLTFFKSSYTHTAINLNPLSILDEFKAFFNHTLLLLISGTLIYFPLGVYIKYKTNEKNFKILLVFLLYISLIEFIQLISHSGIFDINDIITNTLGFFIGVLCANSIKCYFDKPNLKVAK